MARTVRNAKIDTRSARAKLTQRREPYWTVLIQGCAIGYRKGKNGGSWIGRWRGSDGKQHYHAIGTADDALNQEESGTAVLAYKEAQEQARDWFVECGREAEGKAGEPRGPYTVKTAMKDYFAWMKGEGKKRTEDASARADALILPTLGAIELDELTPDQIRNWRTDLVEAPPRLRTRKGQKQQFKDTNGDPEATRRRQATANRTLTILKAALNHAWAENKVAARDAWQRVKPFRDVDVARIGYLEKDQITRLVNACDPGFRPMVQAALLTGCRYGELTAMTCGDFNADAGTVSIRNSKSGKPRHVPLNDEGAAFFEQITAGRESDGTAFLRADGKPWGMSHQRRRLEDAAKVAKITDVSFHILRHSYGSALAMEGVPMAVIAAVLGHADSRMTERHYAALAPSYVAETIRANLPKLGIVDTGNVRTLRACS